MWEHLQIAPNLINSLPHIMTDIHYIVSSHLRADQMCRGSFLGTINKLHHAHHIILPHE